ncbi:hypothetical protein SAMN02910315_01419 [Methanobrevibacter millerae]|uniref:Uncharacterized protein n=1 Tax=Methanobrevibacter millerae TaxID=230361 RepID=A0A1G5WH74_9EURY|nr:hypothetical protein SAMN02910315_01419 [Methanobrevibacter millerae]
MHRRIIWNIQRIIPHRQEIVIEVVKTEERLNLDALAYNIKRLQSKTKKNNNKDDIIDFCESIVTKNQLELNVTITYRPVKRSLLTDTQHEK